jgi:hypothetical protein
MIRTIKLARSVRPFPRRQATSGRASAQARRQVGPQDTEFNQIVNAAPARCPARMLPQGFAVTRSQS